MTPPAPLDLGGPSTIYNDDDDDDDDDDDTGKNHVFFLETT
jgi:hypothetical protein